MHKFSGAKVHTHAWLVEDLKESKVWGISRESEYKNKRTGRIYIGRLGVEAEQDFKTDR